jgi:hypothetical protein
MQGIHREQLVFEAIEFLNIFPIWISFWTWIQISVNVQLYITMDADTDLGLESILNF